MSTIERVTVTLSAELLEGIDRLERNRSRFIAEAVEHELARRRREVLLNSISNPHPETADFADRGLGDWTADLSHDEGLVDLDYSIWGHRFGVTPSFFESTRRHTSHSAE